VQKRDSILCLAGGDSPKRVYQKMVELLKERNIDYSNVQFIGLDEWIGVPPDTYGSCEFFLHNEIFTPLKIPKDNIHLFNALSANLEDECKIMDDKLLSTGGLDIVLVGIGMNGHIGFNEPGVSDELATHVLILDETTRSVGQKYFKKYMDLKKGITLGFHHLLHAKRSIIMASGEHKAEIVKKALSGGISVEVPASILRKNKNSIFMLDKEAASLLKIEYEKI
jgi:galactosamine-6-phosphate isomerase